MITAFPTNQRECPQLPSHRPNLRSPPRQLHAPDPLRLVRPLGRLEEAEEVEEEEAVEAVEAEEAEEVEEAAEG